MQFMSLLEKGRDKALGWFDLRQGERMHLVGEIHCRKSLKVPLQSNLSNSTPLLASLRYLEKRDFAKRLILHSSAQPSEQVTILATSHTFKPEQDRKRGLVFGVGVEVGGWG